MKCTNCGSQKMVKMALIANQIWKVKVADEIKKNKYDKKSEKGIGTGGSFRCFCLLLPLLAKVGRPAG